MFNIGDRFIADIAFPFDIKEEETEDTALFEVLSGEEVEIVNIDNEGYGLRNLDTGVTHWFQVTEQELYVIIGNN